MEGPSDQEVAGLEAMKEMCKENGVDIEGLSGSISDKFHQLEECLEAESLRKAVEAREKALKRMMKGPRYREEGHPHLSPPWTFEWKCSTPPGVCYWAGSIAFHEEFVDIRKQVLHTDHGERLVRKFAGINGAYRQGHYEVSQFAGYEYPLGATGAKIAPPKLALGGKGLRRPGDADVPSYEEIYVPQGTNRKLEHRPSNGRWFFPRPSKLRNECVSE
ncbi:hypothetical protein HDK90DRAFT_466200 [Phyllosticta capitalensis]|uniref:Uncharacterized protein n=1 Tax=Phyllosticta capitalensis TaxID=121624 RepID=A0ABR1YR27_9PEZI